MPIPRPAPTGLLPPFLGPGPTHQERTSPYRATLVELVQRYATSAVRIRLLEGLLAFRAELVRIGLSDGFQWIDGSFIEQTGREPNDLDLVTFAALPPSCDPADEHLFKPAETKKRFRCDAYFVDLAHRDRPETIARAVYWYGLLSHQRRTLWWKGLIQIDLIFPDGDTAARTCIETLKGAS